MELEGSESEQAELEANRGVVGKEVANLGIPMRVVAIHDTSKPVR
jgi:hypothetical protein